MCLYAASEYIGQFKHTIKTCKTALKAIILGLLFLFCCFSFIRLT